MNIRWKVLALAGGLLFLFGVTLAVWAYLSLDSQEELAAIDAYHQPISRMVAEVDVITNEYELVLYRLLRDPLPRPEALAATTARLREIGTRIREDFAQSIALLDRGIQDSRNDLEDRLAMAAIRGRLTYLERQAAPFVELGERVREAFAAGRRTEAEALMAGFERYAEPFGPDLGVVRQDVEKLTASSTVETAGNMRQSLLVGVSLFLLAALTGLLVSYVFAARLQQGLQRLLDGTRAVETGELTVIVQVTSRDEIGQLARGFNHMIEELRSKERIKETFGKYVDPRIVASLIDTSARSLDTAERRSATVFFSDIQGFTAMSEQLTATAMVNLLNHYFTEASAAIRHNNGVIDKYIGDSVMAFWTAPFSPGDGHAADACLAALAQQEALVRIHKELPEVIGLRRNVPQLAIRMGLATGEVVVGTIGSPTAKSFTVIGDTVNLASRLEGANKVYGTRILVADDTYRLAQHAIEARELDLITVVGKTEPIRIHEVLAPSGALRPADAELRGVFAEGLEAYRRQDWLLAERRFGECLRTRPDDAPSRVFVGRVALLAAAPPPAPWDGVWRLTEK